MITYYEDEGMRPPSAIPVGGSKMSRSVVVRLLLSCSVVAVLFTGCTRDPNARKQKYFDSGEKYFAEGKYREAVIQYSNAVQIDPKFAQGHDHLAQAYLKLGDTQRAYSELTRTVELSPEDYRAHTDLANLLTAARHPDGSAFSEYLTQAKPHLDLLRDKQPNNPETHEAWANYYAAQNNLAGALQEAQQTVALDANRSESYLLLALLQIRANQPDQAEANFKKATAVDPKSLNAVLALGGFYQTHNRFAEAEQQFRHAIEIDPSNGVPRAALVRLFMQEGKKDEIIGFLQQTKKDLPNNHQGYTMLGDYYYGSGELDKAMTEYASLYSEHPKDTQVKKNYIQLLILKNEFDRAEKLNNEILKSRPNDVEGLVFKGELLRAKNDSSAAIESLKAALHNEPDNAVAHYQLGLAYAQQRDINRAESEWREAVRIRPGLTDAQRSLATLQIGRGEYDNALQTAQQIINAQPFSGEGFILKGIAELGMRKYADAEHDDREALKRIPQNSAPYIQLGHVQLAQKHYGEAQNFYQQALEKDPSSADALRGLMTAYMEQKQYDKAIAAANAQIAKSPNTSNFYNLLGTALFDGKKDYSGAQSALRKAVDLDKNNVDALVKLGKVYIQQGNVDQALGLYQQASKDNPRESRFYVLTGELYEAKQNWDQAKAMYQQALSVSADDPRAANNLAYLILEHGGNVDVAMNMAQTARRGLPDSPNAADTLGWAYYQKGIFQSAINQFQEALRLNQKNGGADNPVVHYHLGLAYQKVNQNGLARQQLEKAVKLKPEYADAQKALSELRG
jgi:tetratricopeptide (TPR) repeat protein